MTTLCPLDHIGDDGQPAERKSAPGLLLCMGHRNRLQHDIESLPDLYDDLALRLHPSGPTLKPYTTHDSGGTATVNAETGEEESAAFINGRVADLRANLVRILTSWVMLVAEEREVTTPATVEPRVLAPWLQRHCEWIAAQMWADEPASHFHELVSEAKALAYPRDVRRFVCARCVEVTACDVTDQTEKRCGGELVATIRLEETEQSLLPAEVACRVCGQSWTADKWLTLGRRIHREAS